MSSQSTTRGGSIPPVDITTQTSQAESTPTSMPPPKAKSNIFVKHFSKIPIEGDNVNIWASCNYCNQKFKFKKGGGYGTLNRHVETKHPTEWGLDQQQQQLQGTSTKTLDLFKYEQNKWKEGVTRMIAINHLPFSYVENPINTEIIHEALQPAANHFSRNTIRRTMDKLYFKGKIILKNYFEKSNVKFSICSDIWSDHWQTHSYMGVTCHWIDENFMVQKRILAYRLFDDPHTAHNIAITLKSIFQEYSLENKIFSISFDNATSNTASIPDLERSCKPQCGGKFFHIRCAAHVLNICVQDGLQSINVLLEPIKNALNLIWSRKSILKEWKNYCKQNGKRPKIFPRDIPTRWNSTYRLLNDCYEYKDLLSGFFLNNHRDFYFDSTVWDTLSTILNLLLSFYLATERLSGVYYATSHFILQECTNIAYSLQQLHAHPLLSYASVIMKIKLCKYFLNIPPLNLVACVLDPRVKIDGMEDSLKAYYSFLKFSNVNLRHDIFSEELGVILELMDKINVINVDNIILETRTRIMELLGDTTPQGGSTLVSESGSSSVEVGAGVFGRGKAPMGQYELMMAERMKRPRTSYNSMAELDIYLSLEFNPAEYTNRDFDVLTWWREHSSQFPALSLVARSIFGCPVSTVSVEQAFSIGGNTLSARRSMLLPSSLESQVCVDDWTKAQYRFQGQAHLEEYEQFDVNNSDGSTSTEGDATEASYAATDNE